MDEPLQDRQADAGGDSAAASEGHPPNDRDARSEMEELSAQAADRGLLADYLDFLRTSKKWWITPIILALLLVGALVVLSVSSASPLIYPFF